jgi:hypothetical protein
LISDCHFIVIHEGVWEVKCDSHIPFCLNAVF